VEVAIRLAPQGRRLAISSAGHDVAALVFHFFPFLKTVVSG
jgi:hypothetical protein